MYKARISVVLLWWVISATAFLCLDTREAISDISDKYPSEAIGVCDSVEAKTTDACRGGFYQRSPIWSPDGKKFAFLKTITEKLHTIMIYNTEDRKISSLLPVRRPSSAGGSTIDELEAKNDKGDEEPTIWDFAWGPDSEHFAFVRISKKRDENGIFIYELGKTTIDQIKYDIPIDRVVWNSKKDAEGNYFIAFTALRKCLIQKINDKNKFVGKPIRILRYSSENISYPAFSPDGKELVVSVGYGDKFKLVRCNIAEAINNEEYEPEELTHNEGSVSDTCAVYSPDGRYIAFYSTRQTTSPNKYTLWVLDLKEKGFRREKRVSEDYIRRSDIWFMCASWLDEHTLLYKKDAPGELYPVYPLYKVEIKEIKGKMEFTKPEILPPFGNTEHKGLQKETNVIDFSVSHFSKAIAFSHQIIGEGFRMAWIALKPPTQVEAKGSVPSDVKKVVTPRPPEKPKGSVPPGEKEVAPPKSTEGTKEIKEPPSPEKAKESAVLLDKKKAVPSESSIGGIKDIYISSAVVAKEFRNVAWIGSRGSDEIKNTYKEKKTYSLSEASSFLGKPPKRIEYNKRMSEKGWEVVVFKMTGDESGIIVEPLPPPQEGVALHLNKDKKSDDKNSYVKEDGIIESPRGSEELLKAICDKSGFKENSTIHFLVKRDLRLSMKIFSSVVKFEEIKQELLAIVVINGKGKRDIISFRGDEERSFTQDNPDMWRIKVDNQ